MHRTNGGVSVDDFMLLVRRCQGPLHLDWVYSKLSTAKKHESSMVCKLAGLQSGVRTSAGSSAAWRVEPHLNWSGRDYNSTEATSYTGSPPHRLNQGGLE